MVELVGGLLEEILLLVLLAFGVWLSKQAGFFLQEKGRNEQFKGVMSRLNDAAQAVVREVQYIMVEELKVASADGVLTAAEKRQVKRAALENLKVRLGAKGQADLARILNLEGPDAIDRFLGTQVELAVSALGRSSPELRGPQDNATTAEYRMPWVGRP
jgi:hypothetical protein